MNFEIPPGLTDLLQDFTVAVLKEKPTDLVHFAAEYFNKLNANREIIEKSEITRGVRFASPSPNAGTEPMQTEQECQDDDTDDDEPMPEWMNFDDGRTEEFCAVSDFQKEMELNTQHEQALDISEPPPGRFERRKSVSAERYDPEADDTSNNEKIVFPKSDVQRQRLGEAVKPILLFRSLEPEQVQEVLDAMFEKRAQYNRIKIAKPAYYSDDFQVKPGMHVIDQGDDGDNFYVIDGGTYDIFVDNKLVSNYDNSGSFGELALMYNMPRAATIVATSDGTLWAMDRSTFRRIVLKTAFNKRKLYEGLLESVPMLKALDAYERMNIADALVTRTYTDNHVIIQQGDDADCMYIVEEGEVKITVKNKEDEDNMNDLQNRPDMDEAEVTRCNKGSYFGELALVTHKPRAATAYAVGKTKCAVLDVQAFERLLGPCMDIMKRNIDEYEDQLVAVFGSTANISDLR